MIEKTFKLSIALAVLTIWAGIISAALTGSDKAFDLSPVLSLGRGVLAWLGDSAKGSTKEESTPESFISLASRKGEIISNQAQEQLESASKGATDPRLAACPKGAIDSQSKEISLQVAQSLKGVQLADLNDVQSALKTSPACVYRIGNTRVNRYLVRGFRILDARQEGDKTGVRVAFYNF